MEENNTEHLNSVFDMLAQKQNIFSELSWEIFWRKYSLTVENILQLLHGTVALDQIKFGYIKSQQCQITDIF